MTRRAASVLMLTLLLTACASGPPPPDWQLNARSGLDRALAAYLRGDTARAIIRSYGYEF